MNSELISIFLFLIVSAVLLLMARKKMEKEYRRSEKTSSHRPQEQNNEYGTVQHHSPAARQEGFTGTESAGTAANTFNGDTRVLPAPILPLSADTDTPLTAGEAMPKLCGKTLPMAFKWFEALDKPLSLRGR